MSSGMPSLDVFVRDVVAHSASQGMGMFRVAWLEVGHRPLDPSNISTKFCTAPGVLKKNRLPVSSVLLCIWDPHTSQVYWGNASLSASAIGTRHGA